MLSLAKKDDSIIERLPKVRGSYRLGVDLSKITWFRVGGHAEVLFKPENSNDLADFLRNVPKDIPVNIIGVGSNLLVRDGGIDGVVIKLGKGFTQIEYDNKMIIAGAGALDLNVALFAHACAASGLEFLSGIPGTIGGALAMNAGAYGSDIASILIKAEAVDMEGNKHILENKDFRFIYRGHSLENNYIFTKAYFKAQDGNKEDIARRMSEIQMAREDTQPIHTRTGGSTFKNPQGKKAWELIDEAGCRGLIIGGAQVSEKHCNFLMNIGDAKAKDIEMLGEEVRCKVREKSNIDLEWEIKRIGKY